MRTPRASRRSTHCSAILAIAVSLSAPALSGCDNKSATASKDDDGKGGKKKAFDEGAAIDISRELKNTTDPAKAKKLIADLFAMAKDGDKAKEFVIESVTDVAIRHDQEAWGKIEEAKESGKKAEDLLDANAHIVVVKLILKDFVEPLQARFELESLAKGVRTKEVYNQICASYEAMGGKGCPEYMSSPAPF